MHTHTSTGTHVEVFTLQGVVPSLELQCVITALLSPCGCVMTDYRAAIEKEVSHILHKWLRQIKNNDILLWLYFKNVLKTKDKSENLVHRHYLLTRPIHAGLYSCFCTCMKLQKCEFLFKFPSNVPLNVLTATQIWWSFHFITEGRAQKNHRGNSAIQWAELTSL